MQINAYILIKKRKINEIISRVNTVCKADKTKTQLQVHVSVNTTCTHVLVNLEIKPVF